MFLANVKDSLGGKTDERGSGKENEGTKGVPVANVTGKVRRRLGREPPKARRGAMEGKNAKSTSTLEYVN